MAKGTWESKKCLPDSLFCFPFIPYLSLHTDLTPQGLSSEYSNFLSSVITASLKLLLLVNIDHAFQPHVLFIFVFVF